MQISLEKLEKICLKIINTSFYLLLLSPLVIIPSLFYPFTVAKSFCFMALTELIFFTWLFLSIFISKYRPKKNILLISFGIFLIILILSTIFGVDPSRSFWSNFRRMGGLLMWLHLFALFVSITSVFKKENLLNFIFFSIAGATIGALSFWMDKIGMSGLPDAKSGSFIGNSSFLATYLLFNLYFAIYALFALKEKKEFRFLFFDKSKDLCQALAVTGLMVMLLTLLFSTGRAAIVSFFGGLILLCIMRLAFQAKRKRRRIFGKIALTFFVISFLIIISLLFIPNSIVQQKFSQMGGRARPIVWKEAWSAFLEKPILGWGLENFVISSNKSFDSSLLLGEYQFDRAHNIIFDNLIDAGILGLIGYFSVLGSCFYLLWKSYYEKITSFWASSIPAVLIIIYFIKNLSVFDMPSGYIVLIFLFIIISLTTSSVKTSHEVKINKKNHFILPVIFLLLIMLISCLYFFIQKPALANIGIKNILSSSEYNKKAYKYAFCSSSMAKYQIRICLADSMISKIKDEDYEISLEEIQSLEQMLEKSIKSSPLDYYSYLFLGQLYNIHELTFGQSKFERAEEILEKAITLSPTNQLAYWELIKTKISLGKNEETIILAKKAVDLEPKLAKAHIFLVNLYRAIGKEKIAEQKIKQAIQVIPNIAPELEKFLNIQKF
jgi:O-antigen ligase